MTFKKYLPWLAARFFLGGIFIVAGFLKLSGPIENFRGMIVSYGVIPYAWVGPVAHIVPWFEFFFGVCLVVGYLPRISAAFLGLLALSFISLIAVAQWYGTLPENCGCFGDGVHMSPYQIALLDSLNILLAVRLCQIKTHLGCVPA